MARIQLKVNGVSHIIESEPRMPLLWAIRDYLGLTGTKYGCGIAQCGACTVHLDGKPIRSCSVPVSTIENRNITTIEGLSSDGAHPLQLAWQTIDVSQCGYCQTGQIMNAAALLDQNSDPTEDQIVSTMSGNLCRCGTYQRIREAIRKAVDIKKQQR